ncbi:hypothetical protein SLEP1_g28862 [Rubroshorea leprosula]|uniref:Uncharacterized protein n=1 Tax=Rubroshorea leprosula TaxID=152421 RepID=A0AAV5K4F1_9ROSI|nr:hypothetical protein SLEP1_g28862 [Rubroshorea leprosula]
MRRRGGEGCLGFIKGGLGFAQYVYFETGPEVFYVSKETIKCWV